MNKKKLFALSLAVIMIAILSFSTLAWFSDSESVKNDFLIAGSDDANPDEIFSVNVWEDKNGDGAADDDVVGDDEGLIYENILPGDLLVKKAYVENTGSYDQYIRVTVTISDAAAWINALGADADVTSVLKGFDASKWNHIWNNTNGATEIPQDLVYVMYYNETLAPDGKISVLEGVQIPSSLTREQAALFEGGFNISIKADAVQTKNVGVDANTPAADAAWTAFGYVEANP